MILYKCVRVGWYVKKGNASPFTNKVVYDSCNFAWKKLRVEANVRSHLNMNEKTSVASRANCRRKTLLCNGTIDAVVSEREDGKKMILHLFFCLGSIRWSNSSIYVAWVIDLDGRWGLYSNYQGLGHWLIDLDGRWGLNSNHQAMVRFRKLLYKFYLSVGACTKEIPKKKK